MATDQADLGIVPLGRIPLGRIDDGLGLEQGHHAFDVAGMLPVDQQALQILRIARRVRGFECP